ncbi:MAG: NTP transferase domain-containing protein [Chthoniobacterales bacterium]|nr:NTP transferase domain-containing protein [Chthoniobacterales bacterium]
MGNTLLILAAGMGSRYGGLKQIDPVGPSGEVMLDYSVFDAVAAGFDEVVFVIRRDFEKEFREKVVSRYERVVRVQVVFQEREDLPGGLAVPSDREKPWGTGHAIWAARHAITQPFLAINADDFYGRSAFESMGACLRDQGGNGLHLSLVAYAVNNTLSEFGTVSRGVCRQNADGSLASVEEYSGIEKAEDGIRGMDSQGITRPLAPETLVSMNFWGFSPAVFPRLEELFLEFLKGGGLEAPKSEFYIPSAVSALIDSGASQVRVLSSTDHWLGVTYREDRASVAEALSRLAQAGTYPTPLWSVSE